MKKYSFILIAGIAAVALSCSKEQIDNSSEQNTGNYAKQYMVFGVESEASKAVIDGNNINWESTDAISVYDGKALNTFTAKGVDGTSAIFEGEAAIAESYVAVYPNAAASLSDSEIKVNIPTTQNADADHAVDPAAIVAVAKADTDKKLAFSNKFSLVKVTVATEGVTSIAVSGNNSEKIAGKATLNAATLELGVADKSKVTLKYKNGETFPLGDYYIAIYPTTFTKGFRIVMTKSDGAKGAKGTDAEMVFERNGGMDLKNITACTWVPTEIMTAEQLVAWGRISDIYGSKETVKLGADIDLEGAEWTPASKFGGIFDGQKHHIYNFKVTADQNRVGFIGELSGTLKNVCFGSSDYDFTKGSAADAGTADGTSEFTSTISSDPEGWTYIAPVAYSAEGAVVSNVVNFIPAKADATADSRTRLAGITAIMKGNCKIENCVNYARVDNNATASTTNNNSASGGICAWAEGAKTNTISGCVNRGKVMNKNVRGTRIGGILGVSYSSDATKVNVVSNCQNYGTIENKANSKGKANYLGGICGCSGVDEDDDHMYGAIIEKCTNAASVNQSLTSTKNLKEGGIVGSAVNGAQIKGCVNTKAVGSTDTENAYGAHAYIGGIVGHVLTDVTVTKADDGTHCQNSGSIEQKNNFTNNLCIGGICGFVDTQAASFSYCDNSGKVATTANYKNSTAKNNGFGGIVGYDNSKASTYAHCTNSGEINTTAADNKQPFQIGGIVGGKQSAKEITDCHNSGKIAYMKGATGGYAGGVCAIFDPNFATMTNCSNSGLLLQNRNEKIAIGGLAGMLKVNTGTTKINCCRDCSISAPATDNIVLNSTSSNADGEYSLPYCAGLLFGNANGTEKGELEIGPVTVKNGIRIWNKTTNKEFATISADNVNNYLIGTGFLSEKRTFNVSVVD